MRTEPPNRGRDVVDLVHRILCEASSEFWERPDIEYDEISPLRIKPLPFRMFAQCSTRHRFIRGIDERCIYTPGQAKKVPRRHVRAMENDDSARLSVELP